MQQFNNLSSAVDAKTTIKNEAISKSQTSRSNFSSIFRKITMITIASTLCFSVLKGQPSVGVQAGVNFSTLSGREKNNYESNTLAINRKPGFQIGILADLPFGRSKVGFQPELLFSQLGAKLERSVSSTVKETGTYTMNSILIRPHFRFKHAFSDDLALSLHAGTHVAYSFAKKYKYKRFENNKKVDSNSDTLFGITLSEGADFGIGFGAAFSLQKRFQIGVGYDLGIFYHNLSVSLTYMFGK